MIGIDGDRAADDRAIDTDDRGVDEIPWYLDVAGTLSGEHRVDDAVDLARCDARIGEHRLRDREVLVDAQLSVEALHPVMEHRVARALRHAWCARDDEQGNLLCPGVRDCVRELQAPDSVGASRDAEAA